MQAENLEKLGLVKGINMFINEQETDQVGDPRVMRFVDYLSAKRRAEEKEVAKAIEK